MLLLLFHLVALQSAPKRNFSENFLKFLGKYLRRNRFFRSSHQRCSANVFLEISQNPQENTCARVSFLNKVEGLRPIKKQTLAQVFSWELCEISKNTFSTEHLRPTACFFFCNDKAGWMSYCMFSRNIDWKLPSSTFHTKRKIQE